MLRWKRLILRRLRSRRKEKPSGWSLTAFVTERVQLENIFGRDRMRLKSSSKYIFTEFLGKITGVGW